MAPKQALFTREEVEEVRVHLGIFGRVNKNVKVAKSSDLGSYLASLTEKICDHK